LAVPVALAGYMHRDLVEAKQWITDADYKEGLAWPSSRRDRLPLNWPFTWATCITASWAQRSSASPLCCRRFSWCWHSGGHALRRPDLDAVGILWRGCRRHRHHRDQRVQADQKSVGNDKLLWFIYLVLAAVTVITESEVAWLFLAAGVLVWFWRAPPKWLRQGKLNAMAAPHCRRQAAC
jgi:chromate transporter